MILFLILRDNFLSKTKKKMRINRNFKISIHYIFFHENLYLFFFYFISDKISNKNNFQYFFVYEVYCLFLFDEHNSITEKNIFLTIYFISLVSIMIEQTEIFFYKCKVITSNHVMNCIYIY